MVKTKDGINPQFKFATAFFRSIKEESPMEEVVGTLGNAHKWELPVNLKARGSIERRLGSKWTEL